MDTYKSKINNKYRIKVFNSLRGIWKGMFTEKEIDEGIKEIRSKWRIDL